MAQFNDFADVACHKQRRARERQNYKNKSYKSRIQDLMGSATVYEFGQELDLSSPYDMQRYVKYVDEWLRSLRLPKSYASFIEMSHNILHEHQHRKLVYSILASRGNYRAKLFIRAYRRKLTTEEYIKTKDEPQMMEFVFSLAFFTTLAALFQAYRFTQSRGVRAVMSVGTAVSSAVKKIEEVISTAWGWYKSIVSEIMKSLEGISSLVSGIYKMIVQKCSIVLLIHYVKSLFPFHLDGFLSWLREKTGLLGLTEMAGDRPQAGTEEGPLHQLLHFFGLNLFSGEKSKTFVGIFGDLPKVVSIAKAIGWIMEHIGFVYNSIMEFVTGVPRGKNALECEIADFVVNVEETRKAFLVNGPDTIHSQQYGERLQRLEIQRRQLDLQINKTPTLRSNFLQVWVRTRTDFMKYYEDLSKERQSAKPRPVPVWINIYGDRGVGKSIIIDPLCRDIWRYVYAVQQADDLNIVPEPEATDGTIYHKNQNEDYYDSYTGQFFYVIDDLFQSRDPQVRQRVAMDLITQCSTASCPLNVADLNAKGTVFFTSKVILTTTNLGESWSAANLGLTSIDAIHDRRTICVEKVLRDDQEFYRINTTNYMSKKEYLEYDELVALAGNLVIQHEKDLRNPVKQPSVVAAREIVYIAPRSVLDPSGALHESGRLRALQRSLARPRAVETRATVTRESPNPFVMTWDPFEDKSKEKDIPQALTEPPLKKPRVEEDDEEEEEEEDSCGATTEEEEEEEYERAKEGREEKYEARPRYQMIDPVYDTPETLFAPELEFWVAGRQHIEERFPVCFKYLQNYETELWLVEQLAEGVFARPTCHTMALRVGHCPEMRFSGLSDAESCNYFWVTIKKKQACPLSCPHRHFSYQNKKVHKLHLIAYQRDFFDDNKTFAYIGPALFVRANRNKKVLNESSVGLLAPPPLLVRDYPDLAWLTADNRYDHSPVQSEDQMNPLIYAYGVNITNYKWNPQEDAKFAQPLFPSSGRLDWPNNNPDIRMRAQMHSVLSAQSRNEALSAYYRAGQPLHGWQEPILMNYEQAHGPVEETPERYQDEPADRPQGHKRQIGGTIYDLPAHYDNLSDRELEDNMHRIICYMACKKCGVAQRECACKKGEADAVFLTSQDRARVKLLSWLPRKITKYILTHAIGVLPSARSPSERLRLFQQHADLMEQGVKLPLEVRKEPFASWLRNEKDINQHFARLDIRDAMAGIMGGESEDPWGDRKNFWRILGLGLASLGLICASACFLIDRVAPSTAHAQAAYGHQMEKARGARHFQRAARRSKARESKALKAQMTASSLTRLAGNYTYIEVRAMPNGWKHEDVEKVDPLCSIWGLFIHGRTLVTCGHAIDREIPKDHEKLLTLRGGAVTHHLYQDLVIEDLAGDLITITFENIMQRRSILSYFAETVPDYGDFLLIEPQVGTLNMHERVTGKPYMENRHITVNDGGGDFETDISFPKVPNRAGMCGSVYVHIPSSKIVAMHVAGNSVNNPMGVAYGNLIFKDDLMPTKPANEVLMPPFEYEDPTHQVEGINVVCRTSAQCASYIPKETKIRRTNYDLESFPFPETDYEPAVLAPSEEGSPIRVAFDKFAAHQGFPPPEPMKSFEGFLPRNFDKSNVRELSIEEAIYGREGWIDPMDFTTSSGLWWKKRGLSRKTLTWKGNERCIDPRLRQDVEQKLRIIRSGIYPVTFESTLKDELRKKEKVQTLQTRLFDSGDFTMLIVNRIVLGAFFAEACKDPVDSPIAIKLNVHSRQWADLFWRLWGRDGNDVNAGDFGTFDISHKFEPMRAFIQMVQDCYPEESRRSVENCIMSNFCGVHVCNRLVYTREWGTKSGSYITAIYNTFVNWYLHKKAFMHLYPEEDWIKIPCSFLGDDSVVGRPKQFPLYTMAHCQWFFKEYYDMTYTSPTKSDKMEVSWEDLTFLKRKFVQTSFGVMAPLDPGSLANMIKWTEKPGDIDVFKSVCDSVMLEAWHYGPEKYELCRNWVLREQTRQQTMFSVPTFSQMRSMRSADYSY